MKEVWKWIKVICLAAAIGGVIAEVIDVLQHRKEERKARETRKYIHKPYGIYERYFKRGLDFFLSSLALLVLSPVLLVTAILIRIKLGSPVLFVQERPGKAEKIFLIYKFRTMTNQQDREGNLLSDEERLTGFGRTLRSTSLDELPELLNILKGDMSIVGPRPLLPRYLPYYTEFEHHRHDVRPGLTGLAQVRGRNLVAWDEKFSLDIEYVDQITFATDMKVVYETALKVVKKEGIMFPETERFVADFEEERQMQEQMH